MIDPNVELDDDDLDLFCIVDTAPGRRWLTTKSLAPAWKNLERAGAVRLDPHPAGFWVSAIVEPEELDL